MKIILSRKGFDSANGGIVSPIMEDGTLISFPIPSNDKDTYNDLIYCNQPYSKILNDLKYKGGPNCHIDPDLSIDRRKNKIDGWCPIFGQINSSSVYLMKRVGVNVGDLFLFFGNYHKVKYSNGKYQYISGTGDFYSDNDLQLIWDICKLEELSLPLQSKVNIPGIHILTTMESEKISTSCLQQVKNYHSVLICQEQEC